MIQKGFKYRLYPNKEQRELLAKHFGCVRYIYNWGLNQKIKAYETEKKFENFISLGSKLPKLKKELKWLQEVNFQSLVIGWEAPESTPLESVELSTSVN